MYVCRGRQEREGCCVAYESVCMDMYMCAGGRGCECLYSAPLTLPCRLQYLDPLLHISKEQGRLILATGVFADLS